MIQALAPAFQTLQETLKEVEMRGSVTSVENFGFFSPCFSEYAKKEKPIIYNVTKQSDNFFC